MNKLIAMATMLAILTVSTGQLPKVLYHLRLVQLKLLQESKSSSWKTPLLFSP